MTTMVKEAAGKAGKLTGSRMEITLITPGWGSSGYYSPEVLEQAAKDKVFPRKTQMHIDHDHSEGVGSVSTLAAFLNEDARWEPNWVDSETGTKGRLVAEAQVTTKWGPTLAEVAEAIGTSIAAPAQISLGEAEGRQGKIIEALMPGVLNRVDFVTIAGRGGRIQEVLENAQGIIDRAVANGVAEATAGEVRDWLRAAVRAAHEGADTYAYLVDYDETSVWYEADGAIFQDTYTVEGVSASLGGTPVEVRPVTTYVPVVAASTEAAPTDSAPNPAAVTKNQEGATMATIEDKDLADLRESAGRATVAEADLQKANERATATEAALKESNDEAAAELVNHALESAGLKAPKLAARLAEGYPVKENGVIDRTKLAETVAESVAELQVANGAGTVRSVGESQETTKVELTKESAEAAILATAGYTPKGAK